VLPGCTVCSADSHALKLKSYAIEAGSSVLIARWSAVAVCVYEVVLLNGRVLRAQRPSVSVDYRMRSGVQLASWLLGLMPLSCWGCWGVGLVVQQAAVVRCSCATSRAGLRSLSGIASVFVYL
jgi:hypothetical protein